MGKWKTPDNLKYAKTDEWLLIEGDSGTIGVSDYAQDQLNDVVYVELPSVGETFSAGETFGTIESVKAASDLIIPVSGKVTAVNDNLEGEPELVNSDPFGDGWMIKFDITDASGADSLLDAAAYDKFCDERES